MGITDAEAVQAFRMLSRYEGIIPALESSHALAYALKLAESINAGNLVEALGERGAQAARESGEVVLLVNLSGRGDKDVEYVHNVIGDLVYDDPMDTPVTDPRVADVLAKMTQESNAREGL